MYIGVYVFINPTEKFTPKKTGCHHWHGYYIALWSDIENVLESSIQRKKRHFSTQASGSISFANKNRGLRQKI